MTSATHTILIFENTYALTNHLFRRWEQLASEAIGQRGQFCAALCGGKTPIPFYSKLSGLEAFPLWEKTHLFLTDERFVSPQHPDSNFRMIKENLLNFVPIPEDNVHTVLIKDDDIASAAEDYQNHIQRFFRLSENAPPVLDLILLGVGTDGHTASLFPAHPALKEEKKIVIAVTSEHLKHSRITLTFPVLNHAREVIFMVTGENKAPIIKQIIQDHVEFPAAQVCPVNGKRTFYLDRGAAQQITPSQPFIHDGDAIVMSDEV